ncbi:UDP-N-acetylmuramoyl-tripeptide--D-alanyl-D-alanine ligase [Salegentibacter sp. HM20]
MKTAKLHYHFQLSSGVSTDTRNIKKGSLFFALKGANFNGNHYAFEALQKGAAYAVVDQPEYALNDEQYILVDNVLESLQQLATFHRKFLDLPILAITGSNGKTTTKELIHATLSKKYNAVATRGNLNNHIGVPLTLLSMDETTEVGIVEMGANHPLEIDFLCQIALPDYGYITNFGKAHLEGFGSLEGVIAAKSELYEHLKSHSQLIFLNVDDPVQREHLNYDHHFGYGTGRLANVVVDYTQSGDFAGLGFNKINFSSKLSGDYNAVNMAAALCIGLYFKVPLEGIQDALANYQPQNNRSQVMERGSNKLFLDAYNANPTSMTASVTNFQKIATKKPKIAILGDMLELGSTSVEEHQAIVDLAEQSNFAETYLVGENFKKTKTSSPTIIKFSNTENLKEHLSQTYIRDSYILVKGSRGIALEKVVEAFSE